MTPPERHLLVEAPSPRMRRRWEAGLASIGLVSSVVLLGGFSRVAGSVDLPAFTESLYPALLSATGTSATDLPPEQAYDAIRTMGAWFGFTLVVVLLLAAPGFYVLRRHPNLKAAGWWFLAAGLACLLGTQLILFPVAFFFFATAGLFALRLT